MNEEDDFAAGFNTQPQEHQETKAEPTAETKPEPKPEEKPAASPPPAQPEAKQDEDELAAIKAQMADALHRERSSANRVSAFMRENDALKKRLDALEKAAAAKPAAAPAPQDEELDDVLKGAPDLKAAVEARLKRATDPLMRQLEEVNGRLKDVDERASKAVADMQPLRERNEQADAEQVAKALHEQFPGWVDEVKTSKFQLWLGEQSAEIQALYQNGTTVRQAGSVLKLYRADTGALVKPAEAPAPAEQKPSDPAARLRQATGIPSKPAKAKVDDTDDFSAGFRMATT